MQLIQNFGLRGPLQEHVKLGLHHHVSICVNKLAITQPNEVDDSVDLMDSLLETTLLQLQVAHKIFKLLHMLFPMLAGLVVMCVILSP